MLFESTPETIVAFLFSDWENRSKTVSSRELLACRSPNGEFFKETRWVDIHSLSSAICVCDHSNSQVNWREQIFIEVGSKFQDWNKNPKCAYTGEFFKETRVDIHSWSLVVCVCDHLNSDYISTTSSWKSWKGSSGSKLDPNFEKFQIRTQNCLDKISDKSVPVQSLRFRAWILASTLQCVSLGSLPPFFTKATDVRRRWSRMERNFDGTNDRSKCGFTGRPWVIFVKHSLFSTFNEFWTRHITITDWTVTDAFDQNWSQMFEKQNRAEGIGFWCRTVFRSFPIPLLGINGRFDFWLPTFSGQRKQMAAICDRKRTRISEHAIGTFKIGSRTQPNSVLCSDSIVPTFKLIYEIWPHFILNEGKQGGIFWPVLIKQFRMRK